MANDIPTAVFESDFNAVKERQATTFTFSAAEYSGIVHQRTDKDKTEDAGFIREYDLLFSVRLSQFAPSAPVIGSTFSALLGKSFKVLEIIISPCQLIATYKLDTIHK